MHRLIINILADAVADCEIFACDFHTLAKVLLLIRNKMLSTCNHTIILNASNSWVYHLAGKMRVRAEAFLIATSFWESSKW